MKLIKRYNQIPALRKSYSELAKDKFGLDFEPLYAAGYWDDNYNQYGIEDKGEIVSSISCYELQVIRDRKIYSAVQLGAVMTKEGYEGQGLSRQVMEAVLEDYEDKDLIFLFANESVMDFYPKFGFMPAEHIKFYSQKIPMPKDKAIRHLSMTEDRDMIFHYVQARKQNSSSDYVVGDDYLKMFYMLYLYHDNIYMVDDAIVVLEKNEDVLKVHDVYSAHEINYDELLSPFTKGIKRIDFGFEPVLKDLSVTIDESSGMFVKTDIINLMKPWMYPTTSIT